MGEISKKIFSESGCKDEATNCLGNIRLCMNRVRKLCFFSKERFVQNSKGY
jgi:hypothetical protein